MKTTFYSLALAAVSCGLAVAQTTAFTTPVGYVTQTAVTGQFNLMGLTVQNPVVASGVLDASDATSVTDNEVNFTTLPLVAGATYVLELTNGAGAGTIQEVTAWSASVLTTPQNISGSVVSGTTSYRLRRSATVGSVFGPANEAGLAAGTTATADVIWVPNASNSFDQYYRATAQPPFITAGWRRIGGANTDATNAPIVYADSFILQRRGLTNLPLVISGEVKVGATTTVLAGGQFNYVSPTFPVGSTLGNSGLQAGVLAGTTATGDIIWNPQGNGTYLQYYFATAQPPFITAGWRQIGGGNTDRSTVELAPGIIIQRRGATSSLTFTPPSFYSGL